MQDKRIEDSLRSLVSSLQLAKIYPLEHPKFKESVDIAYNSLREMLAQKEELVIGIIGEELAFENEIFLDLSRTLKPIIQYLKERNVERIAFRRQVKKEELIGFIEFLIANKEQITPDAQGYLEKKGIRNISVGKIKVAGGAPQEILESVEYINRYEDSLNKVSVPLRAVLSGQAVNSQNLKDTITGMMEHLMGGYNNFLKLTALKRHDTGTFIHMLDVAILAMHFASQIGLGKEDVANIGIAALFHDIGKIYISQRVIKKEDKLTEEEFASVKSHTALGAQILLKYSDSLGWLPAIISFEHHLRYDLKGYPKLAFPRQQHFLSRIVSICDVYDALNARRSYKKGYPPELIYNLMQKEKGRMFEPELLDKFFSVMGVWPIGTIVVLTDKRIAIVRQENPEDIFAPKVEVVFPLDAREIVDLKAKKEELKIESALDPAEEGKRYFHLI